MSENKPRTKAKSPNPLRGDRLPIPFERWEGHEGDARNGNWQDLANLLRARDLKVYDWPSAYNTPGLPKKQQLETVRKLRAAGYKVEEFVWELTDESNPPGFQARRKGEFIEAIWQGNGSHLLLYWGHPELKTPGTKRNDALIAAAIEGQANKVKTLLRQGADPLALDYSGASVLFLAAQNRRAAVLRLLLDARKTRPTASEADYDLAFQTALRSDGGEHNADLIQVFLDAGATPRQIGTALRAAASGGGS